jgi:hypothetical protein
MTQAERRARAARRSTRQALVRAHAAALRAKKRIAKVGPIAYGVPVDYPPHLPKAPCELPPIAELRARWKAQRLTRKELERTVNHIEVLLGYVIKVYDKAYPKQPTRR